MVRLVPLPFYDSPPSFGQPQNTRFLFEKAERNE
jgi:hypothetical protein